MAASKSCNKVFPNILRYIQLPMGCHYELNLRNLLNNRKLKIPSSITIWDDLFGMA